MHDPFVLRNSKRVANRGNDIDCLTERYRSSLETSASGLTFEKVGDQEWRLFSVPAS